jgi:hypothetical protein
MHTQTRVLLSEPTPIDRSQYYSALATAAQWRDDKDNRGARSAHWATVHTLLTKHAPPSSGSEDCIDPTCQDIWPCRTVRGAIKDLSIGPVGW